MRKRLFLLFLLLVPGLIVPAGAAEKLTAGQIMEKVDETLNAPQDQEIRADLIITDAKGNESRRKMVIWQKGDDRRMVRFLEPPDQRGIAFLSLPGEINYLYLPAYRQTRRIASHVKNQKFAGTDFTYEDMEVKKYSGAWQPELQAETDEFYLLELYPKEGTVTDYGRLVVQIRKDIFFPVKIEFYDKGNNPYKIMSQEKIEQIDGYWVARESEMKDLKAGTKTRLIFTEVKFNTGLADEIFTERYLSR